MSIILGLNCNHADSSACIIKNGKLLFAIEEERINRVKHWAGLPYLSINACLENTNIDLSEITDIAINSNPLSNLGHKVSYFIKNYLFGEKKFEIIKRLNKKLNLKKSINNYFYPKNFSNKVKVHFIDHHISHIASAFYPSGYKKAVGLSIDGFGDFCSVSIAKCSDGEIDIVKKEFFPNSLGVFYETFTQLMGFKNYGDEYKIMGLSSYGKPKYYDIILKNLFKSDKGIKLNLKYFNHNDKNYTYKFDGKPKQNNLYNNHLKKLLDIEEMSANEITNLHKDLSSSVQKIFEEKLLEIIKEIKKLDYSKNLVYAGGCALNSLANKKIYETKLFENVFIPYAPGDGGGSIGAALFVNSKKNKHIKVSNLNSPYIGTEYNNNEIKNFIDNEDKLNDCKIKFFEKKDELLIATAEIIYNNKVVGFFNGRMEFGARALGNRSILANPGNPNMKEIINSKIKRRESFRPFAPAILENHKDGWFNSNKSNPYMSSVEDVKFDKKQIIPSVTHFDGTGRVQSVSKKMNTDFYNLIEEFYKISGIPILLNTSFNENEPIVLSPEHAIKCFLRTEMDTLVLNNFIINR